MSLETFINNEIDIANFKLRSLGSANRPYKKRLAEVEREFLQIDFSNIVKTENEARDAVSLFRVSRPLFYFKYGRNISFIKNFSELHESTLNRKRYILKKAEDLEIGTPDIFNKKIIDIYSYSDLIRKRQISRLECGSSSLSKYIKENMLKIYEEVSGLDYGNIMYARSLVDQLVCRLEESWYSRYNDALAERPFGKIKPLKKVVDRKISSKDKSGEEYNIRTDIRSVGNEHSKIVHLDLLDSNGDSVSEHFFKRLKSCALSKQKMLKLGSLDDHGVNIKIDTVRLFTASTRSESISIDGLKPIVKSICSLIYEEYHSF